MTELESWHFASVRPLVRYVDAELAVVEICFTLAPTLAGQAGASGAGAHTWPTPRRARVLVEVQGSDGFADEQRFDAALTDGQGVIRLEVVKPQRWWPVGMGDQPLNQLTMHLVDGEARVDQWSTTIGWTSVRPRDLSDHVGLLVNGRECDIELLVPVDAPDEQTFLPVTGQSLLVVRGHYGPDVLYDAADRAGIMLVQCVPIDPVGQPLRHMAREVDRLSAHPSLVGWFVGHLGPMSAPLSDVLRELDPTRNVFTALPQLPAA